MKFELERSTPTVRPPLSGHEFLRVFDKAVEQAMECRLAEVEASRDKFLELLARDGLFA